VVTNDGSSILVNGDVQSPGRKIPGMNQYSNFWLPVTIPRGNDPVEAIASFEDIIYERQSNDKGVVQSTSGQLPENSSKANLVVNSYNYGNTKFGGAEYNLNITVYDAEGEIYGTHVLTDSQLKGEYIIPMVEAGPSVERGMDHLAIVVLFRTTARLKFVLVYDIKSIVNEGTALYLVSSSTSCSIFANRYKLC
jgi:hypothetical protein